MPNPNVPAPHRFRGSASLLALALLAFGPGVSPAAQRPYVLGVVPAAPPVATHANWTPFAEELARRTGLQLSLKVYEKMNDFEADLEQGGPDFVFGNPMQVVIGRGAQGYRPLVRGSQPLVGVVVVAKDSPITGIEQLAGQPVAFVGAKSI